jgi:hypothetical protein
MASRYGLLLFVNVATLLTACAPAVVQQPAQFTANTGKTFRLAQPAEISLSTGYSTKLRPGTRWELIGRLPQGEVYRTRDQIVTVEGSHIHEAYLVVDQGTAVGFYLPVERTFSPVSSRQALSIEP